jgi:predicted DNA-binding protein with PD1-like motif
MKTYAFRLKPGDDLRLSIEKHVVDRRIKAGVVLTCVGSLKRVAFRFADQKDTSFLEGKFEIVSFQATLSLNGCHFHLSVADGNGNVRGGHLMQGSQIYTTAEVVIGELDGMDFSREIDGETGFRELHIKYQ